MMGPRPHAVIFISSLSFASESDMGPLGNDYSTRYPAPWQPLMGRAFSFPSEKSEAQKGEEAFSRPQTEEGERKSFLLGTEVPTLLFLCLSFPGTVWSHLGCGGTTEVRGHCEDSGGEHDSEGF